MNEISKDNENSKKIKHLVLSGGGPAGFLTYGALRQLAIRDFWRLENIKSIYGCSVGAFFGVIVSLGYDWEWLDDYFIKRPWEKLLHISALTFFEKKGLLDETFIAESIATLLSAKDLKETITLKEFYAYNHIDLHIYTTNINTPLITKVDLSHTTHPDLTVIQALSMSMCYPFLFKPVCLNDDECYIDGGLINNYPLNDCLIQQECAANEILAFKNVWLETPNKITAASSVLDFLLVLMQKMHSFINTERLQPDVPNTVNCQLHNLAGLDKWLHALSDEETRKMLIEQGAAQAEAFFVEKE
jgi:predicted acylesterase/phospholipase RssA